MPAYQFIKRNTSVWWEHHLSWPDKFILSLYIRDVGVPSFLKIARQYGFKTMGTSWSSNWDGFNIHPCTRLALPRKLLCYSFNQSEHPMFVFFLLFSYAFVDQLPLSKKKGGGAWYNCLGFGLPEYQFIQSQSHCSPAALSSLPYNLYRHLGVLPNAQIKHV